MNLIRTIILFLASLLMLLGIALFSVLDFLPFKLLSVYSSAVILGSILLLFLTFIVGRHQKKLDGHLNESISGQVNPVIFSARSVFPFQLFPDRYILQEKTLSIVRKKFFFMAWTETIPVKDIASVRLYTGPFFVSLTILRKILPQTSIELTDLWKNEGLKFKELLDALIMKENKLVELPKGISIKSKRKLIYEIGHENEVEKEI